MKKLISVFITAMILLSVIPFSGKAETKIITVPFFSAGMWEMKWDFPYSDSYFLESAYIFSRDLAKASLGLTVSAFREGGTSTVSNQYEVYLDEAGFTNLYAFGYDKPTSPETLSGVIASKKIGDFTLIAVSPCGQGYEKEWGGNLNVGAGERHEGFDKGAQILEKEIFSYIEDQKLTGRLKLWISSFSRGAAVSNLAAADLIKSGRFEDVFAYLYAVPRTTKMDTDEANIYNICGACDPVTQIPLESWGYFRNGWDLYLPSAETDVNFEEKAAHANEVTEAVAGDMFRNNPEMNYQLHLILEFIGEMFPDSEEYCEKLQSEIMGLWTEANPDQMFLILSRVFKSLDDLDRRQEYSREVFLDYLKYVAALTVQDARGSHEQRDRAWAADQGMAANLMREHMPYIYLSWIFSDLTDEQLFHGSFSLQRLTVIGDVDVEIWQGDRYLNGIDQNGEPIINEKGVNKDTKKVFAMRSGIETLVFLPAYDNFQVRITTKNSTGFSYRSDTGYLSATYGTSDGLHVVSAEPGTYELGFSKYIEQLSELTALEGKILRTSVSDREYSPTLTMKIQTESNYNLTVRDVISDTMILFGAVIVLLLVCLIMAIVHKVRKKKHGPYSSWYVIIPHFLMLFLFVWLTIYFTKTLYLVVSARVVFAALSGLVLFLLSLRGLIRNRNWTNILIMAGILIVSVINILVYQRSEIVGLNLFINLLYCVIMAALAALAAAVFFTGRNRKE